MTGEAKTLPSTVLAGIRHRIEQDIENEERTSRIREIFRFRQESKRPTPPPFNRPIPETGLEIARETHDYEGEASDGIDWWHAAQADYDAVCSNLTGSIVPDLAVESARNRRDSQADLSIELARALESTGRFGDKRFYHGANHPDSVTVIGIESGAILPIPPLRRVNFFPAVAASNRAKMLRDIEHFILCLPESRKAAMFTITSGKRVPNHPIYLRQGIQDFHRWLSKVAACPAFKRWGVRMEWRASEFGTPSANPETMLLEWHLHAHCLVTVPANMSRRQRGKMRRKFWSVFRVNWDDAGNIRNPREFVKYPVKDADLTRVLRDFGPGALADFFEAVRGLHIVQPMGELRERRRFYRDRARRITAFSRLDGRTLEETGDWNAAKRPLNGPNRNRKRLREMAESLATAQQFDRQTADRLAENARLADEIAQTDEGNARLNGMESGNKRANRPINRVIALLAPAPYGGPICEPGVVVWGFNGDAGAVLRQPRVAAILAKNRAAYERAEQARALIRACAPAARQGSQRSNNCPPDLGDLALADATASPPGAENGGF